MREGWDEKKNSEEKTMRMIVSRARAHLRHVCTHQTHPCDDARLPQVLWQRVEVVRQFERIVNERRRRLCCNECRVDHECWPRP